MIIYAENPLESVKLSAKALHKAVTVAVAPNLDSHAYASPLQAPSLQQCQSVIAIACGFNTYNGLLAEINNLNNLDLSFSKLEDALASYLIQANPFDEILNLDQACDLHMRGVAKGYYVESVKSILLMFQAYPFLTSIKLPKSFGFHYCHLSDEQYGITSKFHQYSSRWIYVWLSSLIIESIDRLKMVSLAKEKTLIEIPLSFFFDTVLDLDQARERMHDFGEIFSTLGVVDVQSGELDFEAPSQSKLNWILDKDVAEVFKSIKSIQESEKIALDYFKSLIEVYPKSFIPSVDLKKLKGKSRVWYLAFRYFFFNIMKSQNKLPIGELIVGKSDYSANHCNVHQYAQVLLNREYDLAKDAVVRLDEVASSLVLPLLREDERLRAKLLSCLNECKQAGGGEFKGLVDGKTQHYVDEKAVEWVIALVDAQMKLK